MYIMMGGFVTMRKNSTLLILFTCLLEVLSTSNRAFPEGFKLGTASAAYQVEGAWNTDGKGLNIFDVAFHRKPSVVADNSTGDVACDSYHKYKEDVALLKDLGVDHYRFSISWARILPTGFSEPVNEKGVQYYRDLIQELKQAGIEPMVTIHHWDLPIALVNMGAWTNPAIADYFLDFAKLLFTLFGEDVKTWITFNEPYEICTQVTALMNSKADLSGIAEYQCAHNILKSHAKVYHLYKNSFQEKQKGKIGIVLNTNWFEPYPKSPLAQERKFEFQFGWFANPLVWGSYPQGMAARIALRSFLEGFPESRLPQFTKEEAEQIKGSFDFLGLNHYTTSIACDQKNKTGIRYIDDISVEEAQLAIWEPSAAKWLKVVPWGLRKLLKWIKDTYNNPEIIITENGYPDSGGLDNPRRTAYYKNYLSAALDAIYIDGVNLTGYTIWSFLDSFEWGAGYTIKFGLYHVDFEDPERKRTPKESTLFYKKVLKTRCLVEECVN